MDIYLAIASAFATIILDCDEAFNYWEPLHSVLYGYGLTPWEYSPKYALRPHALIRLMSVPLALLSRLGKRHVYRAGKLLIALFNHACLSFLCRTYDGVAGTITPGMLYAQAAFLPNSIAIGMSALVLAWWRSGQVNRMLAAMSAMAVLTWPYAAVFYAPMAVTCRSAGKMRFSFRARRYLLVAVMALAYVVVPVAIVDYLYYGRVTLSWLNAVVYNVLGGNDARFGSEPLHYYLANGLVNYNFLFVAALNLADPDLLFERTVLFANIVLLSCRPHKEERFMYPLIPLLVVCSRKITRHKPVRTAMLAVAALRMLAIAKYFRAPETVFTGYPFKPDDVVCFKDEWHRFPSHFFMENGAKAGFLESMSFQGALPQFESPLSLYNDQNARSPTQFTDPDRCTLFAGLTEEFEGYTPMKCARLLKSASAPYRWLWLGDHANWTEFCIFEGPRP